MIVDMELGPGPAKVVEAHELEELTRGGWQLVAIIQDQTSESGSDMIPDPSPNAYQGATITVMRSYPATLTRFLIRQGHDDALEKAYKETTEANTNLVNALEEKRKLEKSQGEAASRVVELEESLESAKQRADERSRSVAERNTTIAELDAVLAKAREHFGSKAFDEAIKVTDEGPP